jgi:hypothetical protein
MRRGKTQASKRTDDQAFRRVVLLLLLVSGISLVLLGR